MCSCVIVVKYGAYCKDDLDSSLCSRYTTPPPYRSDLDHLSDLNSSVIRLSKSEI